MPENTAPVTPVPQTPQTPPPPVQRQILFKWTAPMRHFQKMDLKKYWVILAGVLALFVLLAILGQFWFMAAIAAVMFLLYVLGTVPPADIEHLITTIGVETLEKEYKWEDLTGYWFSKKDDQLILNVETKLRMPARLIMLINPGDQIRVNQILGERLAYRDYRKQSRVSQITDGVWMDMGVK